MGVAYIGKPGAVCTTAPQRPVQQQEEGRGCGVTSPSGRPSRPVCTTVLTALRPVQQEELKGHINRSQQCKVIQFNYCNPARRMVSSYLKYRSPMMKLKKLELKARGRAHRLALSRAKKAEALASKRISPKTAEAYSRYLNLSYAEAVQEIFLITRACLLPLGRPGDF